MTAAIITTLALLFGVLISAYALTWRRYGAEPVRVEAKVEGPSCYPRVKR